MNSLVITMLIDFEERFGVFLKEYIKQNEIQEEDLEEIIPDLYLEWLDVPCDWLDGKSPDSYFDSYDASGLIEVLGKYIFSGLSIPGPLLNKIEEKSKQTYPFLVSLIKNYEGEKSAEMKKVMVQLIEEMQMQHPFDYYIEVIAGATEPDDFSEACAQELGNTGDEYKEIIISAYEQAQSSYSSDCFLDILTYLPYDERTYNYALEKFLYNDSQKAFYASCLGKLGNEKALPYLEEALKDEGITYYDYVSIKNALEELGGEINIERDFTGDKDFESIKNTEDEFDGQL
jgi:hypothetical protein